MPEPDLDETDLRILELLQADGRIAKAEIAEDVSVSESTVGRRIDRLKEDGVLEGFTAQIDGAAVGVSVTAFLLARKAPHVDPGDVEDHLVGIPEVQEVHRVAGEAYWLIKVKTENRERLTELIETQMGEIHGLDIAGKHVSTLAVKETDEPPLGRKT